MRSQKLFYQSSTKQFLKNKSQQSRIDNNHVQQCIDWSVCRQKALNTLKVVMNDSKDKFQKTKILDIRLQKALEGRQTFREQRDDSLLNESEDQQKFKLISYLNNSLFYNPGSFLFKHLLKYTQQTQIILKSLQSFMKSSILDEDTDEIFYNYQPKVSIIEQKLKDLLQKEDKDLQDVYYILEKVCEIFSEIIINLFKDNKIFCYILEISFRAIFILIDQIIDMSKNQVSQRIQKASNNIKQELEKCQQNILLQQYENKEMKTSLDFYKTVLPSKLKDKDEQILKLKQQLLEFETTQKQQIDFQVRPNFHTRQQSDNINLIAKSFDKLQYLQQFKIQSEPHPFLPYVFLKRSLSRQQPQIIDVSFKQICQQSFHQYCYNMNQDLSTICINKFKQLIPLCPQLVKLSTLSNLVTSFIDHLIKNKKSYYFSQLISVNNQAGLTKIERQILSEVYLKGNLYTKDTDNYFNSEILPIDIQEILKKHNKIIDIKEIYNNKDKISMLEILNNLTFKLQERRQQLINQADDIMLFVLNEEIETEYINLK